MEKDFVYRKLENEDLEQLLDLRVKLHIYDCSKLGLSVDVEKLIKSTKEYLDEQFNKDLKKESP